MTMNPIYLSTGAFTGRINGRNFRLLAEHWQKFHCDGFELMVFSELYPLISQLPQIYHGIPIPMLHADKRIGDLLSDENGFDAARDMYLQNAELALSLGAKRMVVHGWGIPDSDNNAPRSYERILSLHRMGRNMGVETLFENCCCVTEDPLLHMARLAAMDASIRFIVDTRPAQFHNQLADTLHSPVFCRHTAHMHINDYAGGYKDWKSLYPIPQPGSGNICWSNVFSALKETGYSGSITLEAPSMLAEGVDDTTLNQGLSFIRAHLA